MKMVRIRLGVLVVALLALMAGCAQAPIQYKQPIRATPPTGRLAVEHAVNVFDSSGSQAGTFASGKATLESIVAVMPGGRYSAGHIHFGGYERETTGQSPFNRGGLASAAKGASFLKGTTPVFDVLENDVKAAIGSSSGRAAVVLISDGLVTDYAGRSAAATGADARTLEAARALAASRSGETCFHTIQVGNDPAGAVFLGDLAKATRCGSFRNASSLASAGALQNFSRQVYLSGAPAPQPAPKPRPAPRPTQGDADADGVVDARDQCPNTLRNARVDSRGCWTLSGVRFAVNSANLAGDSSAILSEDLEVLRANPGVRVRVDGHTDADGSESYNQSLSERRAATVRDYFVRRGGLSAGRFEIKGFGESSPIAPNDSATNKRLNRRVELTIID